jgi:cell division protein FtsQ
MRPINPDQPNTRLAENPGATGLAQDPAIGFWDHIARTRAQEYLSGEVLADCRLPVYPPEPDRTRADIHVSLDVIPETYNPGGWATLSDTLRAVDARPAIDPSDDPSHAPGTPGLATPNTDRLPNPVLPGAVPMQSLSRPRKVRNSRLAYRMQRFWLTPAYRRLVTLGLPGAVMCLAVLILASDPRVQDAARAQYDAAWSAFVDRPSFEVRALRLPDLSPELDFAIRGILEPHLPNSSFRLDLPGLRTQIEALDAIRFADLRLVGDGQLAVTLTHRVPAILWLTEAGLQVLDAEGHRVGFALSRDAAPDLPLIAGDGADAQVAEALALFEAASGLRDRVLGLVRVGERRWDVVLTGEQRIRLPEVQAIAAMEKVVALHQAQDLLDRDLMVTDLRNPARPVLQVSDGALETLRASRAYLTEVRSR